MLLKGVGGGILKYPAEFYALALIQSDTWSNINWDGFRVEADAWSNINWDGFRVETATVFN